MECHGRRGTQQAGASSGGRARTAVALAFALIVGGGRGALGQTPPQGDARCQSLRAEFERVLNSAPGTCARDADCAHHGAGGEHRCDGVTDRASAARLNALQAEFVRSNCRYGFSCPALVASTLPVPACRAGRCVELPPTVAVRPPGVQVPRTLRVEAVQVSRGAQLGRGALPRPMVSGRRVPGGLALEVRDLIFDCASAPVFSAMQVGMTLRVAASLPPGRSQARCPSRLYSGTLRVMGVTPGRYQVVVMGLRSEAMRGSVTLER